MIIKLKGIILAFFCLPFAICGSNLMASNSIKVKPNIPLSKQLTKSNTVYEINKDCEVADTFYQGEVTCDRIVDITRLNARFDCSEKTNIGGRTYYLNSELISVYWNESLILPKGFLIVDSQKKNVLSKDGIYRNPQGGSVYIACEKKNSGQYKHCKVYYISSEPVALKADEGISLTDDCVVMDSGGLNILSYQPLFAPDESGQYYIARREKGKAQFKILKVVDLPEDITIKVKSGCIKNGILKCDGLKITDTGKQIFSNVILLGKLENESINVEWFGCSVNNTGRQNYNVVREMVIPTALNTHTNIYHSRKGTYDFEGGYPLKNYHWGYDHQYILDCGGLVIYGTGKRTIIRGVSSSDSNPQDVFNLVDLCNLTVRDLSVTALEGNGSNKTYGTNAFSLVQNVENITIKNCYVYNLPIVHKESYPDGGKAFTIQVGAGSSQRNILFEGNTANNVAYGLDYTRMKRNNSDVRTGIRFSGNKISNAIVGCMVQEEVWPYRKEVDAIFVDDNEFLNSQIGICCLLSKAVTISGNHIVKNKSFPKSKYYNDYYGIYMAGAFNSKVNDNYISMNDCKSFILVSVYSYDALYCGNISEMEIEDNVLKGYSRGYAIDVGSNADNLEKQKAYSAIRISNTINKQKSTQGAITPLGQRFYE